MSTLIEGEEIHLFFVFGIFIRKKVMRLKFQLNEGEIQRILDLHKTAILKENGKNIIKEELNTNYRSSDSTYTGEGEEASYSLKYTRTFTSKSGKKITLKKGTLLTFKPDKGGASFKYGDKYGWFSCATTNISFGKSENIRVYSPNDDKFTKTLQKVCKSSGVTFEPRTIKKPKTNVLNNDDNKNFSSADEVLRSGESSNNQDISTELTANCSSAEFASKNCNSKDLNAQIKINKDCPSDILNGAIKNFPKATVGSDGSYKLREDGVWGNATESAWQSCQTPMSQGSNGSSGSAGSNGSAGSSGSQGTSGSSGSVGTPTPEDLKLTDAEYVKLTS